MSTELEIEAAPPAPSEASTCDWPSALAMLADVLAMERSNRSDAAGRQRCRRAVRTAARALAAAAPLPSNHETVSRARQLLPDILALNRIGESADPEDVALALTLARKGGRGLMVAWWLAPAWQWPDVPGFDTVPPSLWGEYAAWLFSAVIPWAAVGQGAREAERQLAGAEALARWAERNRGSVAVRTALAAYAECAEIRELESAPCSLRGHAEIRGRLLARRWVHADQGYEMFAFPRHGRPLRVGYVHRSFGPSASSRLALAGFAQLDPARFEVVLFACREDGTELERRCRDHAADFRLLSPELVHRLSELRSASLDVAIFDLDLPAADDPITPLALHRVAPLQAVLDARGITSGLSEVDLYIAGAGAADAPVAEEFSERLALLAIPAPTWGSPDEGAATARPLTRTELGLPSTAWVWASAADYARINAETRARWIQLLAETPGSYLLLHPFQEREGEPTPQAAFCTHLDQLLDAAGLARDRVVISGVRLASNAALIDFLGAADVYLDPIPGDGSATVLLPLYAGLPVVTQRGSTWRSRRVAATLRSLGLKDLIADDEAGYATLALQLARDRPLTARYAERIRTAMARRPSILDGLAASDALGDVLEAAFDELAATDRVGFRSSPRPVRAEGRPVTADALAELRDQLQAQAFEDALALAQALARSEPGHPAVREGLGLAWVGQGDLVRARRYLFHPGARAERDAAAWYALAQQLRPLAAELALQCLEYSLRRDAAQPGVWRQIAELAQARGAVALAQDAEDMARRFSAVPA